MKKINNRLRELRKILNLKQVHFAKKLGVTSQLINRIESGSANLTEPNIRLICFTFNVNESWLRFGTGDILNNKSIIQEQENILLSYFNQLSPLAKKLLIDYAEKLKAYEDSSFKTTNNT